MSTLEDLEQKDALLQDLIKNQNLSNEQIDKILYSTDLELIVVFQSIFILGYLVEKQNLDEKQISRIFSLIPGISEIIDLDQQGYVLHTLIQYKGKQLTNEHIQRILEIVSNLEINQIVKLIKETELNQLVHFVATSLFVLDRLDDNKDKDLGKEPISNIQKQKTSQESELVSWSIQLNNSQNLSKEEMHKLEEKICNIALKIILISNSINSSKQQVFMSAALFKATKRELSEEQIDKILDKIKEDKVKEDKVKKDKIKKFDLKELCGVLYHLINEQKLSEEHNNTIIDIMVSSIITNLNMKQKLVHKLGTFTDTPENKRIDKILEMIQNLESEEQSCVLLVLIKLGKQQIDESLINNILSKVEKLESKEQGCVLECLIEEKLLMEKKLLTESQIDKILTMAANFIIPKQQPKKKKQINKQQVFVVTTLIKKQPLKEGQIQKISQIIGTWDKMFLDVIQIQDELTQAKKQITKCIFFLSNNSVNKAIKKFVFKILKKYVSVDASPYNKILLEIKKIGKDSKISTGIGNKNKSIWRDTATVKKHQDNLPMLKIGYSLDNI